MKLSTRLLLFFLGTMALLLLGFSATLQGLAWKYLHRQADERLEAALNMLIAATEVNEAGVEWEPSERTLSFGRGAVEGQFLWVVLDQEGNRVDGSIPESDPRFPMFLSSTASGVRPSSFEDQKGLPWRFMLRRLNAWGPVEEVAATEGGSRKYQALTIGAAVSLSGTRETLQSLGALLFAMSSGSWLLALFVGGLLSRSALRPVAEMAETARAIRADEPGRRLPEPRSGDELEELGRAFNDLLDRLHESHERQRRFTADASHQLRTPLTAIQGQVALALRLDRSVEEYQRTLTLVQRKTRHLRQIVEALLFLARADAEADRPVFEVVDLDRWLPGHLRGRPVGPGPADVRLVIGSEGPHHVLAHPALLGELLDNLIENADKYGAPGSPISVKLGPGEIGVALSVEDRGPGIAEDEIPRLFEPFYRAEAARRQGTAGLGLGLSVVARLAGLFGGKVVARSIPGRGSTFTIHLPIVAPPLIEDPIAETRALICRGGEETP